jgi:branched-chain amino acid transport system ATP-binding protein
MNPILSICGLAKSFGGLRAISDVNFEAYSGHILTLIGPNGAGKTTVFNLLTGVYKPDAGDIVFDGHRINNLAVHRRTQLGMARTFQNIRLFKSMTVLENILIGGLHHNAGTWPHALMRSKSFRRAEAEALDRANACLEQVGLLDHAHESATGLPYGFQRRLEIARALVTAPKILLLDEPGAGMNSTELNELIQIIQKLKQSGLAILLIEHHMKVVMSISDDVIVLDHGEELAKGKPSEIAVHPDVVSAYLGEALSHAGLQ